jgi:hypothetical protein
MFLFIGGIRQRAQEDLSMVSDKLRDQAGREAIEAANRLARMIGSFEAAGTLLGAAVEVLETGLGKERARRYIKHLAAELGSNHWPKTHRTIRQRLKGHVVRPVNDQAHSARDPAMDQQVLLLRDMALVVARKRGHREEAGSCTVLVAKKGEFIIVHRMPSSRFVRKLGGAKSDTTGALEPKPFSLDVWHGNRKVLLIEWGDHGKPDILSYHRGEWEGELQSLL